ncbi:diaminopropionate ammonia-lyase [Clostridium sp. C105KSO13]|uniref:diaminopropionate ammonia-lyase n=1 Tax=Clostridium sp. C105KSO13 TaxID=1776045 RepID=UPI00074063D5|nr:diaminopropionate ammonia-lyase [Clostridium sp. C105KSO13]CUX46549.1 Diaminopropionate ammonia-lyase [Clostridium sp. C105KSO13]
METIKWAVNHMPKTEDAQLKVMALDEVKKARAFHESFPQYSITPLVKLEKMAGRLGLKEVYVKDESYRFGLNAFKVLGGSFAMARYIAQQVGKDVSELPYNVLTSDELRKTFGQATFFTATDGNHGRGVAWAANKLGQKCVVLMPKGTTPTRLNNILAEGAQATIEEYNYDECVRMANELANKTEHGIMVQDTAWDGYEEIPAWIMQGYGTMASEANEQLEGLGSERPTHVFIQAGVGSLAGAVQGYFANRYPDNPPKVIVVEAEAAACLYKGASLGTGELQIVDGDMVTIMAGLACGEPNTISWDILKNHVDTFVAAPDWVAARGMRMLAAPVKGDSPVTSGESGAAPFGALSCIMCMDEYKDLREHLGLDENSRVLLFSTEGDTDPERYESIVWGGNTL